MTFEAVFEAPVDERFARLQSIQLPKGVKAIEYCNRIVELVCELDGAAHAVSEIETENALLRALLDEFDATAESIVSREHNYFAAVSKLVVRDIRLDKKVRYVEKDMLSRHFKTKEKCYTCGKNGRISKDCWYKKKRNPSEPGNSNMRNQEHATNAGSRVILQ